MSKGVITARGLKYTLSDDVYWQVMAKDANTNVLWNEINTSIESAEMWPSLLSVVIFCVFAFRGVNLWYLPVLYSLGAHLIGEIMSNMAFFFTNNPLLKLIMAIYSIIRRLFLHYIGPAVISLVVLKDWRVAVAYVAGNIVLGLILTFTIGGYKQRESFNDRVARSVMK